MELATGTTPRQAPKALVTDAWRDFLRRVLVSGSDDRDSGAPGTPPTRALSVALSSHAAATDGHEGSAAER